MLIKLLFSSIITFFLVNIGNSFEAKEGKISTKNNIIHKLCVSTLKSKHDLKDKENLNEISDFTCECFFNKYNSGNSLKSSRIYCKEKASEKYNL